MDRTAAPWWRRRLDLRAQLVVTLVLVVITLALSLGWIALWSLERTLRRDAEGLAETTASLAATLLEAAADPAEPLTAEGNRRRLLGHLRRLGQQDGVTELLVYREGGEGLRLGASPGAADPKGDRDLAQTLAGRQVPTRPGQAIRAYRSARLGGRDLAAIRVTVSPEAYVRVRLAPTRRTVAWLAVVDGLLVLLLGGLFLARRILGPLGRLERASAKVAAGDPRARLPVEGDDELARLASRFNDMQERLADKDRRLEDQLAELAAKQRELDQSWEVLLRAAKLASVGRLTAGVAHELGNPMSSILGYLELLGDPEADEARRQGWLARVREEIQRMDRTIRALLETARPGDDAVVRVDLSRVVRGAAELAKHQPRLRQVDVRLDLEGLPSVAASGRLSQVFVNLLLNAGDALGARGVVRISGEAAGDRVRVFVEDDGPGVPEALRRDLFDPFVTTKAPGEGTGLGLAICQSILEASGGRILLRDPQPEAGACFEIQLRKWQEGEAA